MGDCSSLVSSHACTDGNDLKSKMKTKEKVVSKDLHLSPAQSSSRSPMICFPADDSMHRRAGLVLGANKPARLEFAQTNKASNDSFNDRMMNSGVYPCRFCSKQFLSYKAQVGHHTAHERERAYEKNSRPFNPTSFRNYSPYGPHPTISRQAIYQSCSSLLRARFEFMNQKKPLTPWTRSLGFRLNHSGLQPLQQELATKCRNKWFHRHGSTSTPGFEQTDALDSQTKGPTHSRFLNRQEASPNNIFIDHSGLDLTLRL